MLALGRAVVDYEVCSIKYRLPLPLLALEIQPLMVRLVPHVALQLAVFSAHSKGFKRVSAVAGSMMLALVLVCAMLLENRISDAM